MKKKLKIFTKAKIFLSVFLCVLLLGSSFAFADSPSVFYPLPYLSNGSYQEYYDNGVDIGSFSADSNTYSIHAIEYGSDNRGVKAGVVLESGYYRIFSYCPDYPSVYPSVSLPGKNQNNSISAIGGSRTTYNNISFIKSSGFSSYNGSYFTSLDDFINASVTPAVTGSFDLQVGNITFIDLGNSGASYDLILKSYFNKLSGTLSGSWEYDNRRYGFSSSLPDTTFSVDGTSGSGFIWTKTDPKNLLGRSHYGLSNISGTSSGRYLWIVNPLYNENYFNDSLSGDSLNGRINISGLPVGCTFYTYPLVQSATSISLASDVATISGGTGTVSDTGGNTPTVSIDDPNSSYTQPIGGDNSPPQEVTLQEGVNQLFQTLKDFTEKVINLISMPADFIQQLISAGQGFTQAIASMFTWLPESVQDVLIAALGVMIVVGFLKLLF